jgi:hypothetical protein
MAPEITLADFIARYTPEMVALTHTVLTRMRGLVPGAVEIVYDNYNGLVVGFGASERASDAVCSIAVYPKWINLFFFRTDLADPQKLLKGSGTSVRHVQLKDAETLENPAVLDLLKEALGRAKKLIDPTQPGRIVIKSIAAKQRPRTPKQKPPASGGSRAAKTTTPELA